MRRIDEAELLQVRHHRAHGGGRQRGVDPPGNIARADRLAGRQIGFDHLAENVARAFVELGEADLLRADRYVLGQGRSSSGDTTIVPSGGGAQGAALVARAPASSRRMIFSENRYPLFGIMR